jgi:hypothetical protein
MNIDATPIAPERLEQQLASRRKTLSVFLGRVAKTAEISELQWDTAALTALCARAGLEAEACQHLMLRTWAIDGMFILAQCRRGSLCEVQLGANRPTVVCDGTGPTSETHADRWLDGFACAAITRSNVIMDRLLEVPVQLLRDSGDADEGLFQQVEAVQAFVRGDDDAPEKALAALEANTPEAAPDSVEYTQAITAPQLELLIHLMGGSDDEFNATLAEALELHRRYWSHPERAHDIGSGLLPLHLLALASIAVDQGREIRVRSPYLPEFLIRNQCPPE